MPGLVSLILLVFALVVFLVSGFLTPPAEPWRWRLACLGAACFVLAELLRVTQR